MQIRELDMADYEQVYALWSSDPGISLNECDSRQNIASYLDRNPGMSFVALEGRELVGAVLCGHDGRRGYLHHLVVAPAYRRRGIGGALFKRCLERLAELGIAKCNLFTMTDNATARAFWRAAGCTEHADWLFLQHPGMGGITELMRIGARTPPPEPQR
jgi:ribosomal protein S18 acetylase RimI-like enzyme